MIGEFTLKSARVYRGFSQEEMADKLGVHRNTYANWEAHPDVVSIKNAELISQVLQMPISAIFFGTDSTKCSY